jgi:hypothetical protein
MESSNHPFGTGELTAHVNFHRDVKAKGSGERKTPLGAALSDCPISALSNALGSFKYPFGVPSTRILKENPSLGLPSSNTGRVLNCPQRKIGNDKCLCQTSRFDVPVSFGVRLGNDVQVMFKHNGP